MKDFLKYSGDIQNYITNHSFYFIPLDVIAHFVIGILLTITLCKLGVRFKAIVLFILFLAVAKEVLDHQLRLLIDPLESIKDVLISVAYPCFRWAQLSIRKLKLTKD